MPSQEYDAVVVGAGPNGLAAAIVLRKAGLTVKLIEGKETIGGGMRTAELTEPGFRHDVCSAIHPLGAASPVFSRMPLGDHGLDWIRPPLPLAHPFDGETAAMMERSLEATAERLGVDEKPYRKLFEPLVANWRDLAGDILGPLGWPGHPLLFARFGFQALRSGQKLARRRFRTPQARALFAGLAAHSLLPLSAPATAAPGLILGALAHFNGWPFPRGGSQKIADALGAYFRALGGEIETGRMVHTLKVLPTAKAIFLDITPRQLLQICGDELSAFYRWQLKRYRYGAAVFKVDWALNAPPPFRARDCRRAGTVHLGGTLEEIAASERTMKGKIPADRPFVLFAQPSIFDATRAPPDKHTAWAYCHVPHGSTTDMTEAIEAQVERFAPGFRDTIIARHTMHSAQFEAYNPNYVGGDINGGAQTLNQIFTRPAVRFSPYATSNRNVYLCSSSTPPGGGVHGLCGFHAARHALRRIFRISG